MLLPIGHDQTTVRRMPWVTFGIMALCVVAFLWTLLAPGDESAIAEAELRAVEYFLDHPYLELDPLIKGYAYYSLRQRDGDDPPRPSDDGLVRDEQSQLDELTMAFFAARNRLPFWRWGLVPAEMHPFAFVTQAFSTCLETCSSSISSDRRWRTHGVGRSLPCSMGCREWWPPSCSSPAIPT